MSASEDDPIPTNQLVAAYGAHIPSGHFPASVNDYCGIDPFIPDSLPRSCSLPGSYPDKVELPSNSKRPGAAADVVTKVIVQFDDCCAPGGAKGDIDGVVSAMLGMQLPNFYLYISHQILMDGTTMADYYRANASSLGMDPERILCKDDPRLGGLLENACKAFMSTPFTLNDAPAYKYIPLLLEQGVEVFCQGGRNEHNFQNSCPEFKEMMEKSERSMLHLMSDVTNRTLPMKDFDEIMQPSEFFKLLEGNFAVARLFSLPAHLTFVYGLLVQGFVHKSSPNATGKGATSNTLLKLAQHLDMFPGENYIGNPADVIARIVSTFPEKLQSEMMDSPTMQALNIADNYNPSASKNDLPNAIKFMLFIGLNIGFYTDLKEPQKSLKEGFTMDKVYKTGGFFNIMTTSLYDAFGFMACINSMSPDEYTQFMSGSKAFTCGLREFKVLKEMFETFKQSLKTKSCRM